jgi:class 3 adenylate cyclase
MVAAVSPGGAVGDLNLQLRIGINSGPVVAGVIGRKRFLYDLWGDAVNTASRMESAGTPGRIQVTRATHDLIEDEFVLEPRGKVAVKGKGEIETWYLVGRKNQ